MDSAPEAVEKKELKGAEVDFDFKGGQAVITVKHVGSDGFATLEAGINAKPFLNKVIDKIEELIPGDQKQYAALLKLALDKVEL